MPKYEAVGVDPAAAGRCSDAGILGRNVLNLLFLTLDGPRLEWSVGSEPTINNLGWLTVNGTTYQRAFEEGEVAVLTPNGR